jgi:transglutaminase-like putative cysteine protease
LRYSSPVHQCVRRLWAAPPVRRGSQELLQLRWHCTPTPDTSREYEDDFGNRVLELHHNRIARDWEFALEMTSRRACLDAPRETNLPPAGIGAFLLPSARCDRAPAIVEAAQQWSPAEFRVPAAGRADTPEAICRWAHAALRYDEAARGEVWTASEALARGAGVCADYAHLMIALCRVLNIPARYVAGYNPAEGAMHAWCEVLCGDTWRAYDPTHGRATRPDCVFVAAGRDERDCPPFHGTFHGKARVQIESRCKTTVVSES